MHMYMHTMPYYFLCTKMMYYLIIYRNVGEELADEGDQVGAAVATAQTKIISQVS